MGDSVRAEDIETCKENIQPLREGRRTSTLKKIVTTTKAVEDVEKERQSYEIRLQNYAGNDPLELWLSYLAWSKETFPGGAQLEVLPLTERCIQTFWNHATYKHDSRFLRILLQYADMVNNALEIYAGMEQAGIGLTSALFWKGRGRAYEAREDWNNAEITYQRGVDCLAKPVEMMKSIQTEFEARMFRRIKAEAKAAAEAAQGGASAANISASASQQSRHQRGSSSASDGENRAPLGTLSVSSSTRPVERPQSASNGMPMVPQASNNKKRGSEQLEIFVDDEFATEEDRKVRKLSESNGGDSMHSTSQQQSTVVMNSSNPILGGHESRKENQRAAERWIDNKMPQDSGALAAVARMNRTSGQKSVSSFEVFEDAASSSSSSSSSSASSTSSSISKPTALKMREGLRAQKGVIGSSGPYRFTIQSEFYPRGTNEPTITSNGTQEKAAYDRTTVYPGDGKEYSFEEIRAKFYAEKQALAALVPDLPPSTSIPEITQMDVDEHQGESKQLQVEENVETSLAPSSQESSSLESIPSDLAVFSPKPTTPIHQQQSSDEFKEQEHKEETEVEEVEEPIEISSKSLVAEFDKVLDTSITEKPTRISILPMSPMPPRSPSSSDSLKGAVTFEPIEEPLIAANLTAPEPFQVFEDAEEQEENVIDEGSASPANWKSPQTPQPLESRRPFQPRSSISFSSSASSTSPSTSTMPLSRPIAGTHGMGAEFVNDENDPDMASLSITVPTPSPPPSSPATNMASSSSSSVDASVTSSPPSLNGMAVDSSALLVSTPTAPAIGRFSITIPKIIAAAPVEQSSTSSDLLIDVSSPMPLNQASPAPSRLSMPVLAPIALQFEPFEDNTMAVDQENVKPASATTSSNTQAAPQQSKGLRVLNGPHPASAPAVTAQAPAPPAVTASELVAVEEPEPATAEEIWSYNPEENATMSGVTMRTRDAMDEVMGMFHFDNTLTNLKLPADDLEGNYEVTASIVIPLATYAKKMENNFTIFEDSSEITSSSSSSSRGSSTTVPSSLSAARKPSQNDLFVPFEDENILDAPAPVVSLQSHHDHPHQQYDLLVPFQEDPRTPQPQTTSKSRLTIASPLIATTPSSATQSQQVSGLQVFEDVQTPPPAQQQQQQQQQASQSRTLLTSLLAQSPLASDHNNTTTTLNFTMSGMTMNTLTNLDTTTLNTQKMAGILGGQNKKKSSSLLNAPLVMPVFSPQQSQQGLVVDPYEYSRMSQRQQVEAVSQTGIQGLIDLTPMGSSPIFATGQSVSLGEELFTVLEAVDSGSDQHDRQQSIFIIENESGVRMMAQRGSAWEFFISKRVLTKLGAVAPGTLSDDAIEELHASLIDFNSAYVFEDCAWLVWNVRQGSASTGFDKSLSHLIAARVADPKALDEILVWYFTQRLLRLLHGLHTLGFVAGGNLNPSSFWAAAVTLGVAPSSLSSSSSIASLSHRGICLRDYSALVDVESYTAGSRFVHSQQSHQSPIHPMITMMATNKAIPSSSWTFEADLISIAAMAHLMLHAKDLVLEQSQAKFKPKQAPKMFWNAALWNVAFDLMLNTFGMSHEDGLKSETELSNQIEAHIGSKGTSLRFQMGKLSF